MHYRSRKYYCKCHEIRERMPSLGQSALKIPPYKHKHNSRISIIWEAHYYSLPERGGQRAESYSGRAHIVSQERFEFSCCQWL